MHYSTIVDGKYSAEILKQIRVRDHLNAQIRSVQGDNYYRSAGDSLLEPKVPEDSCLLFLEGSVTHIYITSIYKEL